MLKEGDWADVGDDGRTTYLLGVWRGSLLAAGRLVEEPILLGGFSVTSLK